MENNLPKPKRNYLIRIGIPVIIVTTSIGILLFTSIESFKSRTSVQTVTALVKSIETNISINDDQNKSSIIQAPGWVEAEPYSFYAGALVLGTIDKIFVLHLNIRDF